ncbi:hypothetical protein JG688_00016673 [Phytophthora aleatoria]|uniref:Helitron helicase-like domain-containing protein n=1 Tax=Phytophthora aleatoria TaxID=2496075 RepID=A0A8J5IIM5_9STRA|nr:hypothetical protein JG688_00016673 [Phytophthora aleatoria]
MRHVDAFITYALGINPRLFGDVTAYFGMVETQGRGTLHIHFLIWLNNCPTYTTAVERILSLTEGKSFRDLVTSFADSIVTNELPIPIEDCGCSSCGASFSNYVGLALPDSARKDPCPVKRRARFRCTPSEPFLVECCQCKMQFSSQHLLRNALLKFRPTVWPNWKRPLSISETEGMASIKAICRNTHKEAVDIVNERESIYSSFRSDTLVNFK